MLSFIQRQNNIVYTFKHVMKSQLMKFSYFTKNLSQPKLLQDTHSINGSHELWKSWETWKI